ncbi:MAG: hypothetical protein GY765_07265 [bacterium]|nr:hypothetical protein [bacterium]
MMKYLCFKNRYSRSVIGCIFIFLVLQYIPVIAGTCNGVPRGAAPWPSESPPEGPPEAYAPAGGEQQAPVFDKTNMACIGCHTAKTPGIVKQWQQSVHYQNAKGCYDCHQAAPGDKDAFAHSQPPTYISVIVSPDDCGRCHTQPALEFAQSSHSTAIDRVTGSVGVLVGKWVFGHDELKTTAFPEGTSAAIADGCAKCHGAKIAVNTTPDGKAVLDPATWPNMGIGRINPDGSKGSCSACHSGHEFSVAQARRPESCKECHSGASSLFEYAMYMQSKHGINYATNAKGMNIDASPWLPGTTYYAAPTCSTCHMYRKPNKTTQDGPFTHNVNRNIDLTTHKLTPNMKAVCTNCHSTAVYMNLAVQAEAEAALVLNKWKNPMTKLYCKAVDLLEEMPIEAATLLKEMPTEAELINKMPKTKWELKMRIFLQDMAGRTYHTCNNLADFTYISMNQGVRVARLAAFHMSPQFVEDYNKALAESWFGTFIPHLRELIVWGKTFAETKSGKDSKSYALAKKLEAELAVILKDPYYGSGFPTVDLGGCDPKH